MSFNAACSSAQHCVQRDIIMSFHAAGRSTKHGVPDAPACSTHLPPAAPHFRLQHHTSAAEGSSSSPWQQAGSSSPWQQFWLEQFCPFAGKMPECSHAPFVQLLQWSGSCLLHHQGTGEFAEAPGSRKKTLPPETYSPQTLIESAREGSGSLSPLPEAPADASLRFDESGIAYLEAEGEVQVWVNTLLTWSLHLAEDGRAYIFHKDTEEAKWA